MKASKNHNLYCYTFEIGFDHSIPSEKLNQIFNQIFDSYSIDVTQKTNLYAYSLNRLR